MKNTFIALLLLFASNLLAQSSHRIGADTLSVGDSGSVYNPTIEFPGTNVKVRANKSSGVAEFSNDGSLWKKFGSGSGSGSGGINLLENGGIEDGVLTGWSFSVGTVSTTSGTASLLGLVSANFNPVLLNDYYRTSFFTVPKGLQGSACEAKLLYSGGDALNYSAKVETESGITLGSYNSGSGTNVLPSHNSIAGYESVFFKCPTAADVAALSTNGNIRLVIYQGTSTDAASMVIDDVHLGSLIGLVESTLPDTFSARISFTGVVSNESIDFINGSCVVTSTSYYTCPLVSGLATVPLNCVVTPDVPAGAIDLSATIDTTTTTSSQFTYQTNSSGTLNARPVVVSCSKQGVDAKQSVQVYKSVPKISSNQNTFYISVATGGVVTSDDFDIINGNCALSGAGNENKVCSFNSGIFTVTPIINSSGCGTNVDRNVSATGVTSSGATFTTRDLNNSSLDSIFCFSVTKTGSDFKMPTAQPIIIGQVTSSAAESSLYNVRTESCRINNGGAPSIDTASGLCGSWVQSVALGTTGLVTLNFVPGTFAFQPICTTNIDNASQASGGRLAGQTANSVSIQTVSHADAATNYSFTITCKGKR